MDESVKKSQRKSNLPPGPGPGRPKGVPNKVNGLAKDAVARVFEEIGGIANMAMWAKDNPTQFYQLYAKLIPVQVDGAGENGEHLISGVTIKLVGGKGGA